MSGTALEPVCPRLSAEGVWLWPRQGGGRGAAPPPQTVVWGAAVGTHCPKRKCPLPTGHRQQAPPRPLHGGEAQPSVPLCGSPWLPCATHHPGLT